MITPIPELHHSAPPPEQVVYEYQCKIFSIHVGWFTIKGEDGEPKYHTEEEIARYARLDIPCRTQVFTQRIRVH